MDKHEMTIPELVTDAVDSLYRAAGKNALSKTPNDQFNRMVASVIELIKNAPTLTENEG